MLSVGAQELEEEPYRLRTMQTTAAAGQLGQGPAEVRAEVPAEAAAEVRWGEGEEEEEEGYSSPYCGVRWGRSGTGGG